MYTTPNSILTNSGLTLLSCYHKHHHHSHNSNKNNNQYRHYNTTNLSSSKCTGTYIYMQRLVSITNIFSHEHLRSMGRENCRTTWLCTRVAHSGKHDTGKVTMTRSKTVSNMPTACVECVWRITCLECQYSLKNWLWTIYINSNISTWRMCVQCTCMSNIPSAWLSTHIQHRL